MIIAYRPITVNDYIMLFAKLEFELKRKLFHISAILVPVLYSMLPDPVNTVVLIAVTMLICFCDFLRSFLNNFNTKMENIFSAIMRASEGSRPSGFSYMMLGFAVTSVMFEIHVCISAWLVLIFADAAAAVVGQASTNSDASHKTIVGSFAFLTTSLIVSICYLEFYGYDYHFLSLILSTIGATLIEFYNQKLGLNDNFSIPIVFAGVFTLTEIAFSAY